MAALLFCYLLLISHLGVTIASTTDTWILECKGDYSQFTYKYCQETGDQHGCYYLAIAGQYRSCAELCNNVVVGSVDEESCNRYCEGYVRSSCEQQRSTTTTLSRAKRDTTTSVLITTSHDETKSNQSKAANTNDEGDVNMTTLIVSVVVLFVLAATFVTLLLLFKGGYCNLKKLKAGNIREMFQAEQDTSSVDLELCPSGDNQSFKPSACSDKGDPKSNNRDVTDESSLVDENREPNPINHDEETQPSPGPADAPADAPADRSLDTTSLGSADSFGVQESIGSNDQSSANEDESESPLQITGVSSDGEKLYGPSNASNESDVASDHLFNQIAPEHRVNNDSL